MNSDNKKINGWINLNKPEGISSSKCVITLKKILNVKKIGHAGTLDPLASGVLPIAIGEATKSIRFVSDEHKTYTFNICWGVETSTDDKEGTIIRKTKKRPKEFTILKNIETEDLLKFGLIPEFVGRLPVVATLEDLNKDALIEILTKPKNALVKQYQKLFGFENVKLQFTEDALNSVASKALEKNTGARGLRTILESILLDTMFTLPGIEGVDEIVVVDGESNGISVPEASAIFTALGAVG